MTLFSRSLLGGTVALAMATAAQAATQLTVYTAVKERPSPAKLGGTAIMMAGLWLVALG